MVTMLLGNKFGDVIHEAQLVTDPPSAGELVVRTVAIAVPDFRVEAVAKRDLSFTNADGIQRIPFVVTANGDRLDRPVELADVTLTTGADWSSPARLIEGEEGTPAISREFVVTLDPSGAPGRRAVSVALRSGKVSVHELSIP